MSDIEIDITGFRRLDAPGGRTLLCLCGHSFTYSLGACGYLDNWVATHRPHLRTAPTEPAPAVAPAFRRGQFVRILSEPHGVDDAVSYTGRIGQVVICSPSGSSYTIAAENGTWHWSFHVTQLAAVEPKTSVNGGGVPYAAQPGRETPGTINRDSPPPVTASSRAEGPASAALSLPPARPGNLTDGLAFALFAEEHEAEAHRIGEVTRTKEGSSLTLIRAGTRDGSPDVETERVLAVMRTRTKKKDWGRVRDTALRLVGRMGGT